MPHTSVASPGSQPPALPQSQRSAAQQAPSPQALADLLNILSSISSSSSYEVAERIFNEVASLRSQLKSKREELEQVRDEMLKQVAAKQTAINEMFQTNETEKSMRKEATSEIESLKKLGKEERAALARKDQEISDIEGRYQKLQSTHTKLQSDLETARHDIDGLWRKVKEKDVLIDQQKHSHSAIQKDLIAVKERADKIENEKSALSASLQKLQGRLDKITSYTSQHSDCDEDSLTDAFIDLWNHATIEAYQHLDKDLSEDVLHNRSIWDNFKRRSNQVVEHHVPLPPSNSPAAKQMRLAVFLAILARECDRHIFQPTYIVPEDAGIRETLANLAASDHEKESFCRSLLLSINPDEQKASLQSRIQVVIRNASSYLYGMLPDDEFDRLRASVGKIVERAVQVWKPLQRSLQRYEPDFEPLRWGDDQWSSLDFLVGSHAESDPNPDMLDESLVTVFPRLTVVEKGNRFPLTYVVQLRRSQPPCVAAGREVSSVPISPVNGRGASNRPRRKSTASSHASPANGTLFSRKKSPGA